MTRRLYETDSYCRRFTARVLSCEKTEKGYETILDQTAYFPEGGGQGCDLGSLGGALVIDVQLRGDEVMHWLDKPVPVDEEVEGELDFARRLRHMQNHSGEHLLSGLIHRHFGFENVGFHLGKEVTADFDGLLSSEQLRRIENLANEAVYRNKPIMARTPSPEELEGLFYRSKAGIRGAVRLVEIEDYDRCACCAPHVRTTGEIGIIKITEHQKNKGGTRIFLKCGFDALADYQKKQEQIGLISNLLAAKQSEAAAAVQKLEEQVSALRYEITGLKRRLIGEKIACFSPESETTALFEPDLDIKELQLLADGLYRLHGGIRGAFSPQEDGSRFVICGEEERLSSFFGRFRQACAVRGGGKKEMMQGTVTATREAIVAVFASEKT